jgi:UDP-N-acetylglucosamine transferase subunit ALG13
LAGELSYPAKKPSIPVKYLGPLSRFKKENTQDEKHLLILLSGPEPQRTVLENLLIQQLNDYKGPIVFARGLPGESTLLNLSSNICVYNHLPAEELNQKMNEASLVISRCGYSTVMDLAALKKKSILIPTPGQTEQEYLSKHLMKNNFALCIAQNKFGLKNALELSAQFTYRVENFPSENNLSSAIDHFLSVVNLSSGKTTI